MPTRQIIKLPAASGGATGLQEIICKLGYEYFKLFGIQTGGAGTIADITNIQPQVNNKAIWENIDGVDLDAIRAYRGLIPFATNTILVLDFERQKFIDGVPRQATSINTAPAKDPKTGQMITNFGLKYTIGAALTMDWYAEVMPSDVAVGPGYIVRLEKKGDNDILGTKEFNSLPYGASDVLHAQWAALYLKEGAGGGGITVLELKNGSTSIIEPITVVALQQLETDGGQTPGAYFNAVLDFQRYNMPEYLDVLGIQEKSLALKVTAGAAAPLAIIVESLGQIES